MRMKKTLLPAGIVALLLAGCGSSGGSAGTPDARTLDATGEGEQEAVDAAGETTADQAGEAGGDTALDTAGDTAGETAGDAGGDTTGVCQTDVQSAPGVVVTARGAIAGEALEASFAFRGIPYAAPPVGELRWRPPVPHDCWMGELQTTAFGNKCPQVGNNDNVIGDEDCLTLNVWTPKDYEGKARAVMFFIHGGGNKAGSSSENTKGGKPLYDGRYLAESFDIVVVTINYRIGALGFLALPELSAESADGISGNYGIQDQILALQWVQDNIPAFGGDPTRVMIVGESAGAVDVCVLVASPKAAGLFAAAVMQSGACYEDPLASVEKSCGQFVDNTPCKGAADLPACLRDLPVETVAKALPGISILESLAVGADVGFRWGPNVDGVFLDDSPHVALEQGTHNHVPFVVGTMTHETGASMPKIQTVEEYEQTVNAMFGPLGQEVVDKVLALYPATDYASPRLALVALTTDMRFTCTARAIARAAATGQSIPVYRYVFGRIPEYFGSQYIGAFHGMELAYLFHVLDTGDYTPKPADFEVSATMEGYWTRLAATGDPNGDGAVAWPVYDVATDPYLFIDSPASALTGYRTDKCDFWDLFLP